MTVEPNEINRINQEAQMEQLRQEMQSTPAPMPFPGSSRGAWVTLHMHFPSGQEKTVVGYLIGSESGQYKLTKFVIQAEHTDDGLYEQRSPSGQITRHQGAHGILTKIHDGVWLINPMYVWMVEHEHEAPVPGFRRDEYLG